MNCGKSTLLLQRAHNRESRGMQVAVFKPMIDTKGNDLVVSRLNVSRKVDLLLDKDIDLYDLVEKRYQKRDCIFIDEAQFLEPHQVEEALHIASSLDIPVECYGLRTDFMTRAFPGSRRLLEVADSLNELETRCYCGRKATLVGRFKNGEMVLDGEQVEIDNQEAIEYISFCPRCYFERKMMAKEKVKQLSLFEK